MAVVKRLYLFMLQRFLPLFAMTFSICLFILLMQFLFRFVNDIVGKGLSLGVIAELFFYASLTMVPMALPLSILLASLMTFGNLGEKFELTAMKAAGISLFRIMRPLIVFMVFICVGAFYFQNNVLPVAQAKMWTMVFSVRQKTPEVEIPVRSFYDQIPGINLYVEDKDMNTGMLRGITIYDVSQGLENARVIVADSAKLNFTQDKTKLFLHFYRGEMFENLRSNTAGLPANGYMPFRREQFSDKQIYFKFDANFNRIDENAMRSQYVGKNISQLRVAMDSIGAKVDSIGDAFANELINQPSYGMLPFTTELRNGQYVNIPRRPVKPARPVNIDSLLRAADPVQSKAYLATALSTAERVRSEYEFRNGMLGEQQKLLRRHDIELQKKFTLSIACLLFFFIGAPLGAIIKKGGLGTPLVISIFLFIFYFIFDNVGYKMARDGKTDVWVGIWLSTAVLLPLGVFFTYKAVGDSAVFNLDAYKAFFRHLVGKRDKRTLEVKQVIMDEVELEQALALVDTLQQAVSAAKTAYARLPKLLRPLRRAPLAPVQTAMSDVVEYLSDSRSVRVIHLLNRLPFTARPSDLDTIAQVCTDLRAQLDPPAEAQVEPTVAADVLN